jgi:hypothetical protein
VRDGESGVSEAAAPETPAPAADGPTEPAAPAAAEPLGTVTEAELFTDIGDTSREVFVRNKAKPFLVGAIPPRLMDWLNTIQEQGPITGHDPVSRRPIYGEPTRELYESRIAAAGLRGPDRKRMFRTHEAILAKADQIADNWPPGWVKRIATEVLIACRYGPAGDYQALKNGSGSTANGSPSAPSPSSTPATGPSSSASGSATDGG